MKKKKPSHAQVVDVIRYKCGETNVYIADVTGFGVLVYNSAKRRAWRVENKYFYPNPDYGTQTIAGQSFDLMDGVFGLSVTPQNSRAAADASERQLYFQAAASVSLNRVALSVLSDAVEDCRPDPSEFVKLGEHQFHSAAQAMDRNGNLFFGLNEPLALGCWDSGDGIYNADTVRMIAKNETTLQFVSGIKVVRNEFGKEDLWVSTCRFQVNNGRLVNVKKKIC